MRIRAAIVATAGACAVVGVSVFGAGAAVAAEQPGAAAEIRAGVSAPVEFPSLGTDRLGKDLPVIPWRPVGDIWD
ncbi:hypothetical protein JL107_09830 [Nakamurella flavida]|uniref:Uncharacterized protein n=1 Tax=Nakamurella flavida TaxID=363630 RepID=A0A939C0I0_9ACTN|nr:hypothetical protein [Nakamurella flavida]MBM9476743.1 hypothetical protein [Nakamurella flavida]MDP9778819.1 hypothetical protein [Nakamurella flavida]